MEYHRINRMISDAAVPAREIADRLGIDVRECSRISRARQTSERSRYLSHGREIRLNASRFLRWRRQQEGEA